MNRLGIEVLFTLIMAASTFCYWWDERIGFLDGMGQFPRREGRKEPMKQSTATKEELRREIEELRTVGSMMSNICFNLGQRHDPHRSPVAEMGPIHNYDLASMKELQVKWDAIKRAERNR